MISDEELRERLESISTRSNPASATRGISSKSYRRGTPEFEDLMDEVESEWELDEEELENIAEIRRAKDSFEIRFKGSDSWELLEDDEEGSDVEDSVGELEEDFDEEE